MSKHEVVIHENTGATKAAAPYLGSYIAKETVKEPSFALAAAQKAGMSPIQFRAIIDGSFQAIEELEQTGLVRVHTDLGVICAIITGSFPTADAVPDPEKNKLNLCLRLSDEIKLALADVVPTIVADENLTKLRVDNVMDLESPKPYNLIHGQGIFRVAGYNMVLDDVGSTVYLTDKHGVTYEVVVDEVISKQLFKGHTAALLEPGDYKLVVKSRAGDAEGPLQTAFRKVKYLKVAPPEPTREVTFDTLESELSEGYIYTRLRGTNLDGILGYGEESTGGNFQAEVFKNGTSVGPISFAEQDHDGVFLGNINDLGFDVGDTVKVVAQVDPSKTEYSQGSVEAETVLTGE